MTYSEAKAYLDEIAAKNKAAKDSLRTAKQGATNVKALLGGMATQYGPVVAAINTAADANPTDKAWELAKAEAAQMVTDFGNLSTAANDMVTALAGFDV